jgi:hypothetical protein
MLYLQNSTLLQNGTKCIAKEPFQQPTQNKTIHNVLLVT